MLEIEKIIDDLEIMKQSPLMFVFPATPESVAYYLDGLKRGVLLSQSLITFDDFVEAYKFVVHVRGLNPSSLNPYRQLREKGLSEEEVVQEMLEIEIEMWRVLEKWENEK